MAQIFNKAKSFYRDLFHASKGEIDLPAGYFELLVETLVHEHESVCFTIVTSDYSTCGYLSSNSFTIEPHERGFVLKATVESEKVKFIWKIK